MGNRVIQISIDLMIDDDKTFDNEMSKAIERAITETGYEVLGIDFSADMTEWYENELYLPEEERLSEE